MATKRQQSSKVKVFTRSGPEAVIYDLSKPDCVTITLPVGSKWTSDRHWHETHTEFLQVLQGRAFVRLGNRAGVFTSDGGVIEVPKYTVHEWHRVEGDEDQEDVVVREWTMPEDGQKEVFFRVLNSFLTEPHPASMYQKPIFVPLWLKSWLEAWVIPLQLFCIFQAWDNWPVLVGDDSGLFSWTVTHAVLRIASMMGFLLGVRGTYEEYVTEELTVRVAESTKKTR